MIKKMRNIVYCTLEILQPKRINKPFNQFLVKHFNDYKSVIGCELGVAQGNNAYSMFNILKKNNIAIEKLVLVDPYIVWNDIDNNVDNIFDYTSYKKIAYKLLHRYIDCCYFVYKSSDDAIKDVENYSPFDFIYIDACHNYKSVKQDIKNYYPLIKKNGVIGGHDFSGGWGVPFAVLEFIKEYGLKLYGKNTDWWVIKK